MVDGERHLISDLVGMDGHQGIQDLLDDIWGDGAGFNELTKPQNVDECNETFFVHNPFLLAKGRDCRCLAAVTTNTISMAVCVGA